MHYVAAGFTPASTPAKGHFTKVGNYIIDDKADP
jgi:hypothetical protein